jgi:CubicO group peptidase (beta-lactamase class C family)
LRRQHIAAWRAEIIDWRARGSLRAASGTLSAPMKHAWLGLVLLGCGGPASTNPQPVADAAPITPVVDSSVVFVDAGEPAVVYPNPDWPTATPESVDIDSTGLAAANAIADQNGSYCLLVIRHGLLVSETYFNGHDATSMDDSWSIAKSYSSAVVGIALARGDIKSLDDSVSMYVPTWNGKSTAAITIRDLLTMSSNLHWDLFGDYVTMATLAPDKTQYALGLGLDGQPEATWTYDNSAVQVLEAVIRGATGDAMDVYADKWLFSKIGMHASWAHDLAGHPTAYANMRATCRDHARFGYLYRHGGLWAGDQVIPAAYVTASTTPSQSMNRAYGYLWWVNGAAPAVDAMMETWPGWMVPGAPADLFAARGFGNQFIDVIPSLDLLVVRFGVDPMKTFDVAAMTADAKFGVHDTILAPILAAVH